MVRPVENPDALPVGMMIAAPENGCLLSQDQLITLSSERKRFVTVDCVVFGFDGRKINLLLKKEMQKGSERLRLICGSMTGAESADDTASRIIRGATGFNNIQPEQIGAFSKFYEDYDEVGISIAYYATIQTEKILHTPVSDNSGWFSRKEVTNIQPDLHQVIEGAFRKLREKAFSDPASLRLLPEKFTWSQLHKLYEAIAEGPVDTRNLRKKFNALKIVTKLNVKEKSGSKKGSFLFSYNKI